MLKITKFGGSSVANATQFKKVKGIVESDSSRRYVVVSAPGKQNSEDNKITDLLYLLDAHRQYHVDASNVFEIIRKRFTDIKKELGLTLNIEAELDALMMKYHELGHVYYNECINWPVYSKDYTIKMKKGDCDIQRAVNEKGSEFIKLVEKKTKKLLERSSELFHEKYGHSGSKEYTDDGDKVTSPKDYVCPNELRSSSNTLE